MRPVITADAGMRMAGPPATVASDEATAVPDGRITMQDGY
jgi:hypothetical protein